MRCRGSHLPYVANQTRQRFRFAVRVRGSRGSHVDVGIFVLCELWDQIRVAVGACRDRGSDLPVVVFGEFMQQIRVAYRGDRGSHVFVFVLGESNDQPPSAAAACRDRGSDFLAAVLCELCHQIRRAVRSGSDMGSHVALVVLGESNDQPPSAATAARTFQSSLCASNGTSFGGQPPCSANRQRSISDEASNDGSAAHRAGPRNAKHSIVDNAAGVSAVRRVTAGEHARCANPTNRTPPSPLASTAAVRAQTPRTLTALRASRVCAVSTPAAAAIACNGIAGLSRAARAVWRVDAPKRLYFITSHLSCVDQTVFAGSALGVHSQDVVPA